MTIGILVSGALAWRAANKVARGHSGPFVSGLWIGYCALCIFGYLAGSWLGLLVITLPCLVLFWIGLYRIAAYILPLSDAKKQRPNAFRSLLTFTMGTNYPLYVATEGKLEERVPGNVYRQFFAGPGLIITRADQTAYRTDGVKVLGIAEPGVTFTKVFELPPQVVDLRPQLQSFTVQALTKDGIPVQVLIFIPFQIQRGGQEPELGKPYPFRRRAILEAMARRPVERGASDEDTYEHEWNVDLVPIVATRVVQDLISHYKVDELCAADDPSRDPRMEIVVQLRAAMKKEMVPFGIKVLGGGISNLIARDDSIVARRVENWRTEWVSEMLVQLSAGDVERKRQIEQARAEAEASVVLKLGQVVEKCLCDGPGTQAALALRFVDCLGEIVSETETQWPLPETLKATLNQLRGKLVAETPKLNAPKG